MLTPPLPQMQVQQLIQMKQQQVATVQAAAQQKAGQPQQGQASVQQKVTTHSQCIWSVHYKTMMAFQLCSEHSSILFVLADLMLLFFFFGSAPSR